MHAISLVFLHGVIETSLLLVGQDFVSRLELLEPGLGIILLSFRTDMTEPCTVRGTGVDDRRSGRGAGGEVAAGTEGEASKRCSRAMGRRRDHVQAHGFVRVVLTRPLVVGLLDLARGGRGGHPEGVVQLRVLRPREHWQQRSSPRCRGRRSTTLIVDARSHLVRELL